MSWQDIPIPAEIAIPKVLEEIIMAKGGKGGGGKPPNGPSTTGRPSGPGRGNNPPKK